MTNSDIYIRNLLHVLIFVVIAFWGDINKNDGELIYMYFGSF